MKKMFKECRQILALPWSKFERVNLTPFPPEIILFVDDIQGSISSPQFGLEKRQNAATTPYQEYQKKYHIKLRFWTYFYLVCNDNFEALTF